MLFFMFNIASDNERTDKRYLLSNLTHPINTNCSLLGRARRLHCMRT
jgi:hypothetical protein